MNIGERLLVAVVPVDMDVEPLDVLVGMGGGLLVAVMLGDSTAEADMNVSVDVVATDMPAMVDMDMRGADMGEGLLGAMVPMDMDVLLVGAMVPVDMDVLLVAAAPLPGVDMNVLVDMAETLDIVMPTVVDIDNCLGRGGFGMPASMLNNLLWHYHYAVTLVFQWWRVPVV